MKNRKLLKVLLVVLAVVVAGVIFSITYKKAKAKEETLVESSETFSVEDESETDDTSVTDETAEQICVYVCGCVVKPGVYYLDNGERIFDAVDLAGGFTEDADQEYLNLAAVAEDGQQIYIPSVTEVEQGVVPVSSGSSLAESDDGLVNINTATAEELATLPGIGDTKAAAIITYRENVGPFSDISDIMNVAGIKESSYDKIKDYIKV